MNEPTKHNLPAVAYDALHDPRRVVTVRLPAETHEQLKEQAHDLRVSLNRLCLSRLVAPIAECTIHPTREKPKREVAPFKVPE